MRNLSYTSRLEMLGLDWNVWKLDDSMQILPCATELFTTLLTYPLMSSLNIVNITVHVHGHPLKLFQPVARIIARAHFLPRDAL